MTPTAVRRARTGAYHANPSEPSRPFHSDSVEAELRAMWKRQSAGNDTGAVYRAALSNLVVPVAPALEGTVAPILIDVTCRHPSRLISIGTGCTGAGTGLCSRVGMLCYTREEGGGLVCCEHIMLQADAASAPLIPSAVRSLLIGDLPTVLLDLTHDCAIPWVQELIDASDIVIEDTQMRRGREEILACWRRLKQQGSVRIHDLAWARISPWREIVAELFDRAENRASLATIREIEVEFSGDDFPPSPAWLLVSWLHARLGLKKGDVAVRLRRREAADPGRVETFRLVSADPHPLDVIIRHPAASPTASIEIHKPRAQKTEAAFSYRTFADSIAGEIHRHEPNRALEEATRIAEELMSSWYDA